MNTVEGWSELIREHLTKHRNVTDEKQINEIIETFSGGLEKKNRYVVVAYKEEKPIGYLSGGPYGIVFETSSFFLHPEAIEENVGSQLVESLAKKAFDELEFKYFRQNIKLPFDFGLTFKENLLGNGFKIFERCEMVLDPTKVKLENHKIPKEYSFEPFTKERVDEIIGVMCKANVPGHPDLYIYPEMSEVEPTKEIFARLSKNFEALGEALNPQIVKENKIAGMSIVLRDNPTRAYIAEVAIHPDHQKKGLGKALMKKIIDECAKENISELLLACTKSNIVAYDLYLKLGFKEIHQYLAITIDVQKEM